MSTKKSKIKSIVTVNAYAKRFYTLKDQKLKPLKKLTYNSSNFVTSYLSNKDMITTTIDISRSIPLEDIQDIIEIKAYEELGLDQANEYVIKFYEGEGIGDVRKFNVFVVEPEVLEETFEEIKEETKYIDLLVPAPLLYQPIYSRGVLAKEGTHCFIYFTMKDAFITFYKNGEYLYSKSIDYSMEFIYDKYCELTGDKVNEEEFFKILESEGLKTIHADYQQNLMKLFGEIFITINDIIIYAKRAYDLPTIDQMFIGSTKGPIIGLDEYSENYLGLQSSELNFNFELQGEEWYTDQLQYLMVLTAQEYIEDNDSTVNLTPFERAPEFYKRASGQFIITTLVAIMLGISYPLYFLVGSYMNDAANFVLAKTDAGLKEESTKYKKILGDKKKEINGLDQKIGELSKVYHAKETTLTSIYDKKVHYNLKSELFHNFANEIKKFDVSVSEISSNDDTFVISLLSKDEKKITALIKYISEQHFDKI
ncbi:MAG: hypothetical protein U9Q90_09325, partial [Campylobacterota bacterium]|nr:hypothetical protein [Campylobacterota bacterium]